MTAAAISTTAYTHTTRAPYIPDQAGCEYQRWYGSTRTLPTHLDKALWVACDLTVFRNAAKDQAEVTISISGRAQASITAQLLPHELRELASRLLDAAADIEANPAPRTDFLARVEGVYA